MYKVLGQDGKEYGPVSADVLRQWHAQGRLNAQTRLCAEGAPDWKPLSDFPELASMLAASPPAPAVTPPPPAAPVPAPQSGLAIASLVLGILSLFCGGIVLGLPAIITGHLALGRARRAPAQFSGKGLAIAGLALGYFSTLLTLLLLALLLPAMGRAQNKAVTIQCVSNMKQIGLAARIYSNDNADTLPKDFLSMSNELATPKILRCPADTAKTAAENWAVFSRANVSYEFLTPGAKEADVLRAPVFRCPIHNNICFGDGSVERGDMRRQR